MLSLDNITKCLLSTFRYFKVELGQQLLLSDNCTELGELLLLNVYLMCAKYEEPCPLQKVPFFNEYFK